MFRRLRLWFTLKRLVVVVLVAGVAVLAIGLGTYEILLATESSRFCGTVCHTPMYPEYTTYQKSPHSVVPCTSCHVGAGSYNLISSKARGIPQIWETITRRYPRPIPSPVENLRPARETCEQCHTPSKFTGYLLQSSSSFKTDQGNTKQTDTIVLDVGGGLSGVASGIHWHTAATVWYLPMDEKRLQIGWVGVEQNGVLTEFIDPAAVDTVTPQRIEAEKRRMDCVDCHNRATHIFASPNDLIDRAMAEGSIDSGLPFIKREALAAAGSPRPSVEDAYSRVDAIKEFYKANYPRLYADNSTQIDRAVIKLREISTLTTFPTMSVDWNTHADHSGHNKPPADLLAGTGIAFDNWRSNESEGCFRCHWKLVPATRSAHGFSIGGNTGYTSGTPGHVDASCTLCHYTATAQPGSPVPAAMPHPTRGLENCLVCHAPGALKPIPTDHPWTNDEACTFCHTPPQGNIAIPVPQQTASRAVSHPTKGLENCLLCHGPGKPAAFVPAHPWATDDTCAACHKAGTAVLPVPAATPPSGVPSIPHGTRRLEDCLLCHGPTSPKPFFVNHPWTTNDTCYACHGPAQALEPLPSSPPPSGLPAIKHNTRGLEDCLLCHGPGKPRAFVQAHPWTTNETCLACHTMAPILLSIPMSTSTAPKIVHAVAGRTNCRACHGVSVQIGVNHETIPLSLCIYCHTPS
jgi:hypothetical protein